MRVRESQEKKSERGRLGIGSDWCWISWKWNTQSGIENATEKELAGRKREGGNASERKRARQREGEKKNPLCKFSIFLLILICCKHFPRASNMVRSLICCFFQFSLSLSVSLSLFHHRPCFSPTTVIVLMPVQVACQCPVPRVIHCAAESWQTVTKWLMLRLGFTGSRFPALSCQRPFWLPACCCVSGTHSLET